MFQNPNLSRGKNGGVLTLGANRAAEAGFKVQLFLSSFAPTPDSLRADFLAAVATFTGYASTTITWAAIGLRADNEPAYTSNAQFFQATDAVTPNTIGGFWVEDAGMGPKVWYYCVFSIPISMTQALNFINIVIERDLQGFLGNAEVQS